MVTESNGLLAGIDIDAIESGEQFKRTEMTAIVEVVEWDVVAADERYLEARRWDFRSPAWKALFPDGFPVIQIGLKGINVRYKFSADEIRRIQIPIRFELGHEKAGQVRGRGSQMHIVNDAFKGVYGVGVIPTEKSRPAVLGIPTLWGQHLGEMADPNSSQPREWGWDIPREKMPPGFVYTGEVRVIEGRQGNAQAGAGGSTVGTAQLSEDDTNAAVAKALDGLDITDGMAHSEAILNVPGLGGSWYDLASGGGNVAKEANDKGLIKAGDDGKIHAITADEPEAVATK